MELRSYNVQRIYSACVKCVIGEELAVNRDLLQENAADIKSMISQIKNIDGYTPLCLCNRREDDEIWTPYLQIVEMLIRLGRKLDYVYYNGVLGSETFIRFMR